MSVENVKRYETLRLGALIALAACAGIAVVCQSLWPHPFRLAGITVDRLSALLTLLVGIVGTVTFRFSLRYLDGEPAKARFLNFLFASVCAAYLLMLSTNLVLLFLAWLLTSMGLHRLLTFYPDRPQAIPPARKKFIISRLGDLALIAAIAVVWQGWHTTDLHVFLSRMTTSDTGAQAVAVLVSIAALTKSAQFPFHSWLPETMESPTPVSALMHAGIINAGGALLIRFAPLIATSPLALSLLILVGTLTATLGMLAMWAQVKVKRTLAWSTVSQMGFMMVQCGLGVFPAAALHIVGHGFYKAWSFLRTGTLPGSTPKAVPMSPAKTLAVATAGTVVAIPALYLASRVTGFNPCHSSGEFALSAVIAMSLGQIWAAIFRFPSSNGTSRALRWIGAMGLTLAGGLLAFCLYQGATIFLEPVLGPIATPAGPLAVVLAAVPVLAFASLLIVHAILPTMMRTSSGRAFFVHALHGFYFGALADRFISLMWRNPARKDLAHA